MSTFAEIHAALWDELRYLADLSLPRDEEDLNEENVAAVHRIAALASAAVVAQGNVEDLFPHRKHGPWLRFAVQFHDNGSDADTVSLLLSSMRGCVIDVDGTQVHYSHLDAHGSLQVCGTRYGTDEQVSIPLTDKTTITIL